MWVCVSQQRESTPTFMRPVCVSVWPLVVPEAPVMIKEKLHIHCASSQQHSHTGTDRQPGNGEEEHKKIRERESFHLSSRTNLLIILVQSQIWSQWPAASKLKSLSLLFSFSCQVSFRTIQPIFSTSTSDCVRLHQDHHQFPDGFPFRLSDRKYRNV